MSAGARHPWSDPRFRVLLWLTLGAIGWIALLALVAAGLGSQPPKAGFDLKLVLDAGKRVASGASPYDPALVAGSASLQAQDLFYSYPPPVAQAAALVSALPLGLVLVALDALAVAGLGWLAWRLGRELDRLDRPVEVALATVALAPFVFPFTVALLFGNLDAFYPLAFGLLLLAVLVPGRRSAVAGGIALALVSIAKLHPAVLGLWLLARGAHEWRAGRPLVAWRVLAVAVIAGVAVLGGSLALGGLAPWTDYASVLRTISGARVVLANNVGPAAQIALQLGLGDDVARLLQVLVLLVALAVVVLMGWYRRDPVESLGFAVAASLIVLPITWFHYPAALIPFALAALLRARGTSDEVRVGWLVAAAVALGVAAMGLTALVLLALVAALFAARGPRPLGRAPVEAW
ncbi:MAG TPA: glycosyltransferase family 87 protein [Candidatus Dormibacteraeota bacterium]|nr:glycosyltransferase family 87 protein [Candidatus Dormibacteraeota bacterium]